MATLMKKTKNNYPKVKYRVVNGNGYTLCDSWEEVERKIDYYKTDPNFKDKERFQIKHVIKVTEELIEV
jgi:hypothetical protein